MTWRVGGEEGLNESSGSLELGSKNSVKLGKRRGTLTWDGGREALRVLHEHLAQLLAADVGRSDEDDGPLVIGPRVVEPHLLVGRHLSAQKETKLGLTDLANRQRRTSCGSFVETLSPRRRRRRYRRATGSWSFSFSSSSVAFWHRAASTWCPWSWSPRRPSSRR